MLQFVIGSSGAGKSRMIYEKIIAESLQHPEKQYFVLIPEQASLEAQKSLVALHPGKGIINIDTLSFVRLAYRVFNETGVKKSIVLDDAGKTLIVRRVLTEKRNELKYFAGNAERRGFCEEMKSVISELFQYGVDDAGLARMLKAAEGKNVLTKKLNDIEIVYKGFKDFMRDRFITSEEMYEIFAEAAGRSKLLCGATVVLDGFTGFTPSQYCLLEALMKYCEKVYITISMDASAASKKQGEHELFYLSYKTMERMRRLAENVGCPVGEAILLPEQGQPVYRFAGNPSMAELEKKIFRNPVAPFEEKCPVELKIATNPTAEVKALVCEIKKSLREGLRYRDMAVITGDLEGYAPIFTREFAKAEIPAFLDFKRSVAADPVVELIRALLELPESSFSYEGIFRLLKCTLFELDAEALEELENYVLAMGVRGESSWKKEWVKTWKRPHPPALSLVNTTRENIMERLSAVLPVLESKTATVHEKISALRGFMESEQVKERLEALCVELEAQNALYPENIGANALLIKEYDQIIEKTEEIFNRTDELLGDEIIGAKDFRELIELGFSETRVGVLPQGMDGLVVGDVERSRITNIKKLFFVGVNEGIIPSAGNRGGIISDSDRNFFAELGFELSPTLREKAYTQEFYLYLNLTKPTEKMYISYSEKSSDEKALLPSYLIATLKSYYLGLKETKAGAGPEPEYLLGADKGFETLTAELRNLREAAERPMKNDESAGDDTSRDVRAIGITKNLSLLSELVPLDDTAKKLLVDTVFYKSPEQRLRAETALKLYNENLYGSVSRLEQFATCNMKHFLQYGLGLNQRKEFEILLPDIGNIFHDAMLYCSEKLHNEKRSFTELTDDDCISLAAESARIAAENYENGLIMSSKRTAYMVERIKDVVVRTLKTTRFQLRGGRFEPAFFEEDFECQAGNMNLHGRIDRMDVCFEDDKCYVKVVDYKSGSTTLDLSSIYYGQQLQLGVYLGAALKMLAKKYPEYKAVPAAIFYYHLRNPLVDGDNDPEISLLKELKPDGLVNSNPWVIKMLDEGFGQDGKTVEEQKQEPEFMKASTDSLKIPVKTNKEGGFDSHSKVAPEAGIYNMVEYLNGVMEDYAAEISAGAAEPNPVRREGRSACENCDYMDVCAFGSIGGKKERVLKKLGKEEVWELIGQKTSNQ